MKTATALQLNVLTLVNNFGYLTTREVGILAYPLHPAPAAIKAAQKVVARLRAEGLLLARELPYDGLTNAYVLTRAAANMLCDHHLSMAFSHGYDITMNDIHVRRPMIELLGSLVGSMGLEPVGSRGLARNYLELGHLKRYDALLVNANGEPVLGVANIHGYNAAAQKRISDLASRQLPFVIATTNPMRLERLVEARNKLSPTMAGELICTLPSGVFA